MRNLWVVWSEEHGAWWRPGHSGYTNSLAEAGRYGREEATAIVRRANIAVPPPRYNEIAIPDPMQDLHWIGRSDE